MSETSEIYLVCALAGGTLLVCQFLLGLLGIGHHDDLGGGDHDFHDSTDHHGDAQGHDDQHDGHHGSWFIGVLSFRSLAASVTFFGLTGLAASVNWKMDPPAAFGLALAVAAGTLVGVAYLMRLLHQLKAEGNVHIERAVGKHGTVYLSVPGQNGGAGKVHLNLQNRTVEYQAITPHAPLPTGAKVVVTRILNSDTVEVALANETGSSSHA